MLKEHSNYQIVPANRLNHISEYYFSRKLKEVARKHNLVVVNDNPYSFILNKHPLSILSIPGAKDCCIEFNSMSKSHNMPGWRIGMLATNATFVKWILKVKSNIDCGMFKPLQLAAASALEEEQNWYDANNQNYLRRKQIAEKIMHALGCQYDKQQVGLFLWGKIPSNYKNVEELTDFLLQKARVFITPGFIFGSNGARYIRLSLCCNDQQLEEALQRIQRLQTDA